MTADVPGASLQRATWIGTGALTVATVPAVLATDELGWLSPLVSLPLFVLGAVAMLVAFLRAVERSRTEAIGMGGLYLLAGSAPTGVQRSFLWSLGLQTAVGLTGAVLRPYTALAFGVLAPLWGLGLAGLWGARHGTFLPRAPGSEAAGSPPDAGT